MVFDLVWRRLLQIIPVAIGVTFIAFGILNLLPGGTAATILGGNATPQAIAQLDKTLERPEPPTHGSLLGLDLGGVAWALG